MFGRLHGIKTALSGPVRNIHEVGLGALYAIGALFNLFFMRTRGQEFYASFAEGAVIAPMRKLIREFIIPNARTFTLYLVSFQVLAALATRSYGVRPFLVSTMQASLAPAKAWSRVNPTVISTGSLSPGAMAISWWTLLCPSCQGRDFSKFRKKALGRKIAVRSASSTRRLVFRLPQVA